VITQAHLALVQWAQVGDRAQVGVFRAGGIGAGALEKHQLFSAGLAGGAHRVVELAQRRHAGGDDQRFACGGGLLDQGQLVVREAGDLEGRHIQLHQEVDRRFIKG
jgi:hypothetical protein